MLPGNRRFKASGFFVIRSPLLPWDEIESWSCGLEAATATTEQLAEAMARDRARLRAGLRTAVLRPEVREALFVASPALEGDLEIWLQQPESDRGCRLELALVRYYQRMCGRATPFGLCAGISVGNVARHTRLILPERQTYRRHIRLDMECLAALVVDLQQQPEIRPRLCYRPNSSLYEAGGWLRYVESKMKGKIPAYFECAVVKADALTATLDRAREGACAERLIAALVDDDVSLEDAREYVEELISSQILVPSLGCILTGDEPLPSLLAALHRYEGPALAIRTELASYETELASMDRAGLGLPPRRYRDLAARIETNLPGRDLASTFQVDLIKPAPESTLGEAVLDEIARGVEMLRHVIRLPQATELERFRDAFGARYEDREVPLLEALDEECGIGFRQSSAAGGAPVEVGRLPLQDRTVPWGRHEEWLLRRLSDALSSGATEIELSPSEITSLGNGRLPDLPDSFSGLATVIADSAEAVNHGRFRILLQTVMGPSGAAILGRFCHDDESLHGHVRRLIEKEEALDPDAVFAEIVHLPEPRLGNILLRPVLRDYEIPYLGYSGAPDDRQLPVSDLWLSIKAGKLVLRSRRLGKRVIPRLTSAHNYRISPLPIYRFLCGLAEEGVVQGGWDWGPLRLAPFLPRVCCGRLILQRAIWHLHKDELRRLDAPADVDRFRAAQELRGLRRLPRRTIFWDEDNALPVDFDNCLSVENFVHLVRERDFATLTEFLPATEQLALRGPEGGFVHELIVPFVREPNRDAISSAGTNAAHRGKDAARPGPQEPESPGAGENFPPGSSWLFAKIYCGPAMADHLLRDELLPFIERIKMEGVIDRWFFIRYGDPDWHLRLRFHGDRAALLQEVLPALHDLLDPHLATGALARWQLDTYRRETERYGGPQGVLLAEEIFELDSEAVLGILGARAAAGAPEAKRWWLGICGLDRLLDDLGLDLESKLEIVRPAGPGSGAFAQAPADRRLELGRSFRRDRKALEDLLRMAPTQDEAIALGFEALQRRSARLAPIVQRLKATETAGLLTVPIATLGRSYAHMHVNRLLRSEHQEQERMIYDALVRLYESVIARKPGDKTRTLS